MGAESAFARGVSADGSVIIGNFQRADKRSHAFRYSRLAGVEDLGVIGGRGAFANGISDTGVIVGTFFVSGLLNYFKQTYDGHMFVYTKSAGVFKMGTIGGESAEIVRISADGERIVGSYRNAARESYVYIATLR